MRLPDKPHEVHLLALCILYVLGFSIYLNSLSVPFVFDDFPNIRDNPSVRMTSLDVESVRAAVTESPAKRRPLANVSFALNHLVGGYDVKGYHLVNIFLHIANGVLVYFLALILLGAAGARESPRMMPDRRLQLAALLAGAIFIAHPLQVQAVTYIVQRMTSMATLFYLLSLLLFVLGRRRRDRSKRSALWAGAFVSWLLALGAKEIAATLPVMIVVTEYLFFRDRDKPWPGMRLWYPLVAVAAVACAALLYLGADPATTLASQYADREYGAGERMLTELRVLVYYLSLMILPLPGRLSLEHTFSVSRSLVDPATTLAAATVLAAMLYAALRCASRQPIASFCILWYLVTLSVESSFVGLELAFEHRLYLPMFGFSLMVGYLSTLTPDRHSRLAIVLGVGIVAALSTISIARNTIWQDSLRLWMDTVAKNPMSHRAHNNLGRVLIDRNRPELAAREFEQAIRIEPGYAEPYNNLGTLHARAGRLDEAVLNFAKAIEANPTYAHAYNNLGVALLDQGRARDAVMQLGRAVRIAPGYAKAHGNLAIALARLGRMRESCVHLRVAVDLDASALHSPSALDACGALSNSD